MSIFTDSVLTYLNIKLKLTIQTQKSYAKPDYSQEHHLLILLQLCKVIRIKETKYQYPFLSVRNHPRVLYGMTDDWSMMTDDRVVWQHLCLYFDRWEFFTQTWSRLTSPTHNYSWSCEANNSNRSHVKGRTRYHNGQYVIIV